MNVVGSMTSCYAATGSFSLSPVEHGEVIALAQIMTWKIVVVNVRYGGAKGEIASDPKELSIRELKRLTRVFAQKIHHFIGVTVDVPTSYMGTNAQEFLTNCYGKLTDRVLDYGRVLEIPWILEDRWEERRQLAVGFGNVGSWVARLVHELNVKIIAASDVTGAVRNPEGIDIPTFL
ncbi:glutamate dehydrogenase 2-like protein [Tanacetum coccineum]